MFPNRSHFEKTEENYKLSYVDGLTFHNWPDIPIGMLERPEGLFSRQWMQPHGLLSVLQIDIVQMFELTRQPPLKISF